MSQIKSTTVSFAADPKSTIYQRRRKRRWSVEELSRRSEVSTDIIRYCERTATEPDAALMERLQKALDADGRDPLPPLPPIPTKATHRLSVEFVEQTRRIQQLFPQRT